MLAIRYSEYDLASGCETNGDPRYGTRGLLREVKSTTSRAFDTLLGIGPARPQPPTKCPICKAA